MEELVECKRCLYKSNHPLNLSFENGICSGCLIHEEKYSINWDLKFEKLNALITQTLLEATDNSYDCIVPIGAGIESYYVLDKVINTLKLKPLAVFYNTHSNSESGIRNLALAKTFFDCDFVQWNPDPNSIKMVTKFTAAEYQNVNYANIAGRTSYPVREAILQKIPLIFWGGHQGVEQVGMFSHHDEVEMNFRYRIDHDLLGVDPNNLENPFSPLGKRQLKHFWYPSDFDINSIDLRGIYLSNYFMWDPAYQNAEIVEKYGFYRESSIASFDKYEYANCSLYSGLHDWLKHFKFGYSKVTDHASREIRHGRISRKEAKHLVSLYEKGLIFNDLELFKFLGVEAESFLSMIYSNLNITLGNSINPYHKFDEVLTSSPSITDAENYTSFLEPLNIFKKGPQTTNREFISYGKGI